MRNKAAIPSATGHWLLGSALDFTRAPHLFAANLARDNGGLASFRALHNRFLVTSSAKIAHHILVSRRDRWRRGVFNRKLATMLGDSLLATEGDVWKRHHGVIQPLLRRSEMAALAPVARQATTRMLEAWRRKSLSGETVSIVHETRSLALDVIAKKLLSVTLDDEEQARFGDAMREAMLLLRQRNTSMLAAPIHWPTPRNRALNAYRRELDQFFARHIDARLQR